MILSHALSCNLDDSFPLKLREAYNCGPNASFGFTCKVCVIIESINLMGLSSGRGPANVLHDQLASQSADMSTLKYVSADVLAAQLF